MVKPFIKEETETNVMEVAFSISFSSKFGSIAASKRKIETAF